jgi:hypothetical protein
MNATPPLASVALSPPDSTTDSTHPCGQARARRLTVSYLPAVWPAYTPRPAPLPYLRLRGRWLEDAGFAVGTKIRVRIERQRLILEVENEPPSDSPVTSASVHEPRTRGDGLESPPATIR